jgi:hypothetical protein
MELIIFFNYYFNKFTYEWIITNKRTGRYSISKVCTVHGGVAEESSLLGRDALSLRE